MIREGSAVEQINAVIEEDRDIAILVLAASSAKEGPGPLVSSVVGKAAAFPDPRYRIAGYADERGTGCAGVRHDAECSLFLESQALE